MQVPAERAPIRQVAPEYQRLGGRLRRQLAGPRHYDRTHRRLRGRSGRDGKELLPGHRCQEERVHVLQHRAGRASKG